MPRSRLALLVLISLTVLLSGCGFQLRGYGTPLTLPVASLYADGADPALTRAIRNELALYPGVNWQANAKTGFRLTSISTDKQSLSLKSSGKVAEYRLNYRVHYTLFSGANDAVDQGDIVLHRDFAWDDGNPIGMENQEQLLLQDMRDDVARQLLRRASKRLQ